jgi:hypothetical protein
MKRTVEIASGIGVFITSLTALMALLKAIFDLQQSTHKAAASSILLLGITAVALFFSFASAFILLSWANKPK